MRPQRRRLAGYVRPAAAHRTGRFELGYWQSKDAVIDGYVTAAAGALPHVGLSLDDVGRVQIHCDDANVRRHAVPRRLGDRLDRVEPDGVLAPDEVGASMTWVYPQ